MTPIPNCHKKLNIFDQLKCIIRKFKSVLMWVFIESWENAHTEKSAVENGSVKSAREEGSGKKRSWNKACLFRAFFCGCAFFPMIFFQWAHFPWALFSIRWFLKSEEKHFPNSFYNYCGKKKLSFYHCFPPKAINLLRTPEAAAQ